MSYTLTEADKAKLKAVAMKELGDEAELSALLAELRNPDSKFVSSVQAVWPLTLGEYTQLSYLVARWRQQRQNKAFAGSHVKGEQWTRAELEKLEAEVAESSQTAVAARHGVSRQSISKQLDKLAAMREGDKLAAAKQFSALESYAKGVAEKRNPTTKARAR